MFIIHKKQKKHKYATNSKINYTSLMFHNIFSEMNIKKVLTERGARGNGETFLISSWKWNY